MPKFICGKINLLDEVGKLRKRRIMRGTDQAKYEGTVFKKHYKFSKAGEREKLIPQLLRQLYWLMNKHINGTEQKAPKRTQVHTEFSL